MTHDPHPRIDPDRLRTLAARGRLMLCGLLAWIAETFAGSPLGRAMRSVLRADIQAMRRGIAGILMLLAIPQLAHVKYASRQLPPAAPRGFRRARRTDSLRFAMRLLPRSRTVRGAIAALVAVLDDLDRWTERMAAHIARDLDLVAALIMTCATFDACASQARMAASYADTS